MTTTKSTRTTRTRRTKRTPSATLFCGFHHRNEQERDQLRRVMSVLRRSKSDVCRMALRAYCDGLIPIEAEEPL